jgi:NADPH:quinone reductase-like Zn-dependent oxidoreductase
VKSCRAIGADFIIDYTKEDFSKLGRRYDVVFDNTASQSLVDTRKVLAKGGIIIPNAGMLDNKWLASVPRLLGGRDLVDI